jgi:hypothetical protein
MVNEEGLENKRILTTRDSKISRNNSVTPLNVSGQ